MPLLHRLRLFDWLLIAAAIAFLLPPTEALAQEAGPPSMLVDEVEEADAETGEADAIAALARAFLENDLAAAQNALPLVAAIAVEEGELGAAAVMDEMARVFDTGDPDAIAGIVDEFGLFADQGVVARLYDAMLLLATEIDGEFGAPYIDPGLRGQPPIDIDSFALIGGIGELRQYREFEFTTEWHRTGKQIEFLTETPWSYGGEFLRLEFREYASQIDTYVRTIFHVTTWGFTSAARVALMLIDGDGNWVDLEYAGFIDPPTHIPPMEQSVDGSFQTRIVSSYWEDAFLGAQALIVVALRDDGGRGVFAIPLTEDIRAEAATLMQPSNPNTLLVFVIGGVVALILFAFFKQRARNRAMRAFTRND